MVGVYFFIVRGAESIVDAGGTMMMNGSAENEAWWILVMFGSYIVWDVFSKWGQWAVLAQRLWGTVLCAGIAGWMFAEFRDLRGAAPVVSADLSLLALVFLFRAMKLRDFSEHTRRTWSLVVALLIACATVTGTPLDR